MEKKILLLENIRSTESALHAIVYFEENSGRTTVFLNIYGEEDQQNFLLQIHDIRGETHSEEFRDCCKVFVLKNIKPEDIVSCNVYIDKKLVMVQKEASGTAEHNTADFYLDIADSVSKEQAEIDKEYEQKEEILKQEKLKDSKTLLEELGGSYEELFALCDTENILESIFKDSKFVRVPGFGKNYVAGIIRSSGKPKFMCFGMPVFSRRDKPEELGEDACFVPASKKHEDGFGYYIVFRDVQNKFVAREAI